MEYLALVLFILVIACNIIIQRNSMKRKKKEKKEKAKTADRKPPVFELSKNYFPMYEDFDIKVSDFAENGGLVQLHCEAMCGGELIRGFCTKDLIDFECKVRSAIRETFKNAGDESHDGTIKMWYYNADRSVFESTDDIPLKIAVTFYKPQIFDDSMQDSIKQSVNTYLHELLEIDWNDVNAVLKKCFEQDNGITTKALENISKFDYKETEITSTTQNVCRHLKSDMSFFYSNQWFYDIHDTDIVYKSLMTKYSKIEERYLDSLLHDYTMSLIF